MTTADPQSTPSAVPLASVYSHTEPYLFGSLVVHTHWAGGRVISEVFTFDCLAGVLGLPESVLEGRYKRTGLRRLAVRTVNEFGREVRAFPMAIRDEVIAVLQQAGLRVQGTVTAGGRSVLSYTPPASHTAYATLNPTFFKGEMYFTVQALADCFGVTHQTVRLRVKAAGLWGKFVPLGRVAGYYGRPASGLPYQYLGDVWLAMRHPQGVRANLRELLREAHTSGAVKDAQARMEEIVAVPATADPTAADPERGTPVSGLDALCEEINRALA